jgi:hypothetical protein
VSDGFIGLPPHGASPSTPLQGDPVWTHGDIHPWWSVHFYADGRVIWLRQFATRYGWLERRLSREGMDLIGSNEGLLRRFEVLPASAWRDTHAKQFIPSRYLACTDRDVILGLSPTAQDLLRGYGSQQAVRRGEDDWGSGHKGATCPVVSLDEAQRLDGILRESGFVSTGLTYVRPGTQARPVETSVELIPLLPDGSFQQCCPG